jgi:hypothetical protein
MPKVATKTKDVVQKYVREFSSETFKGDGGVLYCVCYDKPVFLVFLFWIKYEFCTLLFAVHVFFLIAAFCLFSVFNCIFYQKYLHIYMHILMFLLHIIHSPSYQFVLLKIFNFLASFLSWFFSSCVFPCIVGYWIEFQLDAANRVSFSSFFALQFFLFLSVSRGPFVVSPFHAPFSSNTTDPFVTDQRLPLPPPPS